MTINVNPNENAIVFELPTKKALQKAQNGKVKLDFNNIGMFGIYPESFRDGNW